MESVARASGATSGSDVTLLLGGMGTSLSPVAAGAGRLGSFAAPDGLLPFLRGQGWPDADAVFSYRGVACDGAGAVRPLPYTAADTFRGSIAEGVALLGNQLARHLAERPGARVTLIGHSLGGLIAFGYLARLTETREWALPRGGRLSAVVTLDAPLGGVFGNSPLQIVLAKAFVALLHRQRLLGNVDDLVRLWRTAAGREPFGAHARLAAMVGEGRRGHTNQQVARDARAHGVRLLTVGSRDDRIFAPGLRVPPFPSVQWLADDGPGSGIYGRVARPEQARGRGPRIVDSHGAVLRDPRVHEAVWSFLCGQDPTPLDSALMPRPVQPAAPAHRARPIPARTAALPEAPVAGGEE